MAEDDPQYREMEGLPDEPLDPKQVAHVRRIVREELDRFQVPLKGVVPPEEWDT
jgi:hypothetical protein